jgi:hypothetical protein
MSDTGGISPKKSLINPVKVETLGSVYIDAALQD